MRAIRCQLAAVLFAISGLLTPAWATSFSTDQSDLWYVLGEPGWGMQLVQRGNVIFATLFVYDPSGNPIWYSATLTPTATDSVWSGDLYLTTGPWFALGFNPASVKYRKVGTMTWYGPGVDVAVVDYSVDGIHENRAVERLLLVYDNYNGTYIGALRAADDTLCLNPVANALGIGTGFVTIVVVQNGQSVSISLIQGTETVTINGTLTQGGQFGRIQATYVTSAGEIFYLVLFEINGQRNYWTARFGATSARSGCHTTGYLGGIRQ